MRHPRPTLSMSSLLLILLATFLPAPALASEPAPSLAFVENRGQEDARVRFRADGGGLTVWLIDDGFRVTVRGSDGTAAVGFTFEGASKDVLLEPVGALPGRVNVLRGTDPRGWRVGLSRFEGVRYRGLVAGVDLRVFSDHGRLEYDVVLAPGADPAALVVRVDGARALRVADDGALVVDTPAGPLRHVLPATFRETPDGERIAVAARVRLLGERRFGFVVDDVGPRDRVVIDPSLEFSTYVGGPTEDVPLALAVDPPHVYLIGYNNGGGFPTSAGALDATANGQSDVVVSKLNVETGQLVFSTYLGGSGVDSASGAVRLANGDLAVAGVTYSFDFPTTAGAHQTTQKGNGDAFVAILSADGSTLLRSTLLGGTNYDAAGAVVVDPADGRLTIVGRTDSPNLPTTAGAGDATFGGISDAFLATFSPDLSSLLASTYLGGTSTDVANGVARGAGAWFVVGRTSSADFPATAGAFDTTLTSSADGFVTRVSDTGAIAASTFLGASQTDELHDVAVDAQGRVHAIGTTFSPDLPVTAGAFDATFNGGFGDSAFVRLDADLATLEYGSFLGGAGVDTASGIAFDAAGRIVIVGHTTSSDFPVSKVAYDGVLNGTQNDAFCTWWTPDGEALLMSSLFGGPNHEYGYAGLGVMDGDRVCLGGSVTGHNLPLGDVVHDGTFNGGPSDGWLAVLEPPACATAPQTMNYGLGKAGTNGVPGLSEVGSPIAGDATSTIVVSNVLPGVPMTLFLGLAPADLAFDGGKLLVQPTLILALPPAGPSGTLTITGPVPNQPVLCGATIYHQVMLQDPGAAGYFQTAQTDGLARTFGSG